MDFEREIKNVEKKNPTILLNALPQKRYNQSTFHSMHTIFLNLPFTGRCEASCSETSSEQQISPRQKRPTLRNQLRCNESARRPGYCLFFFSCVLWFMCKINYFATLPISSNTLSPAAVVTIATVFVVCVCVSIACECVIVLVNLWWW